MSKFAEDPQFVAEIETQALADLQTQPQADAGRMAAPMGVGIGNFGLPTGYSGLFFKLALSRVSAFLRPQLVHHLDTFKADNPTVPGVAAFCDATLALYDQYL